MNKHRSPLENNGGQNHEPWKQSHLLPPLWSDFPFRLNPPHCCLYLIESFIKVSNLHSVHCYSSSGVWCGCAHLWEQKLSSWLWLWRSWRKPLKWLGAVVVCLSALAPAQPDNRWCSASNYNIYVRTILDIGGSLRVGWCSIKPGARYCATSDLELHSHTWTDLCTDLRCAV